MDFTLAVDVKTALDSFTVQFQKSCLYSFANSGCSTAPVETCSRSIQSFSFSFRFAFHEIQSWNQQSLLIEQLWIFLSCICLIFRFCTLFAHVTWGNWGHYWSSVSSVTLSTQLPLHWLEMTLLGSTETCSHHVILFSTICAPAAVVSHVGNSPAWVLRQSWGSVSEQSRSFLNFHYVRVKYVQSVYKAV